MRNGQHTEPGWRGTVARLRAGRWGWFILVAVGLWRLLETLGTLDFARTYWTKFSPDLIGTWLIDHATSNTLQIVLVVTGLSWVIVALYLPKKIKPESRSELVRQHDEARLLVRQLRGELQVKDQRIKELTPPERVFFNSHGFCWQMTRYFFEKYDEIDTPNDLHLDYCIRGPFCPECGRNLRIDSPGSQDRSITVGCPCGVDRAGGGSLILLRRMQREIYKEAQRLTRYGKDLPAGSCAKPPKIQ